MASRISCPIPTELGDQEDRRPRPRVRPGTAGEANYEKARGAFGPLLELQGRALGAAVGPLGATGMNVPYKTSSQPVKDHIRENVRRMREIQAKARQREEEFRGKTPLKPHHFNEVYTSSTSKTVHSTQRSNSKDYNTHPAQYLHRPNSVTGAESSNAKYLRAHEKTGPILDPEIIARPLTPVRRQSVSEKISVPRASSARDVHFIRRDVDFVRANAHSARSARMRPASPQQRILGKPDGDKAPESYRRGEVPNYLRRRQNEWSHDDAMWQASQPDPEQPAGHHKMPDEEKRQTLSLLQKTYGDLEAELCHLPIACDTLRAKQCKQSIEAKMAQIEEAIKIFSRPKVFIKND